MTEGEVKKIKRIYLVIMLTIGVLVLTQLVGILLSSAHYMIGIVISLVISGARFFYLKRKGAAAIRKILLLALLLVAVVGPIVFGIVQMFLSPVSFFTLNMLSLMLLILPIVLLLYAARGLNKLLSEQ